MFLNPLLCTFHEHPRCCMPYRSGCTPELVQCACGVLVLDRVPRCGLHCPSCVDVIRRCVGSIVTIGCPPVRWHFALSRDDRHKTNHNRRRRRPLGFKTGIGKRFARRPPQSGSHPLNTARCRCGTRLADTWAILPSPGTHKWGYRRASRSALAIPPPRMQGAGGLAQGLGGWLCQPVAAPIGLSPLASALPRASWESRMQLLPMASSPDGLISARYVVITKTPGREVLTTTRGGGGAGFADGTSDGAAVMRKANHRRGLHPGPQGRRTVRCARAVRKGGHFPRRPR